MNTEAIHKQLDRANLARLWDLVAEKIQRLGRVGGKVTLQTPTPEERCAVADLLAWRSEPSGDIQIQLLHLDEKLRNSRLSASLEEVLTLIRGPLVYQAAERAAKQASWDRAIAEAHKHPASDTRRRDWLDREATTGTLKRLAGSEPGPLLRQTLDILAVLPIEPAVLLPEFAAAQAGHTHALDQETPLARLVLRALAFDREQAPPTSAEQRRILWDRVGIVCDELSCDVLVLNLRPTGQSLTARILRHAQAEGEPMRLTLRQVCSLGTDLDADDLFVTENPTVLAAAAAQHGAGCPSIVCTSGFPTTAVLQLIRNHSARQTRVHYHGDFDWAGIRIAAAIWKTTPFQAWQYDAARYLTASENSRIPMSGVPADTPWAPDLKETMQNRGIAVHEEMVLGLLLTDLDPS